MTESNVVRVMREFKESFVDPGKIEAFRGFLLDDGWDNYDTLWEVGGPIHVFLPALTLANVVVSTAICTQPCVRERCSELHLASALV